MNRDGFPGFVLNTMKNLNMVMILYLTMVTVHSLYGYMDGNSAMDFLMQVKRMPMEPWKLPVLSIGLFVCLLLLLSIRCQSKRGVLGKTVLELGVVFAISYVLNFSYTGMALLIIADTMSYFSDWKQRVLLAASVCVVYMLLDYDLLSAVRPIISLETCWGYYGRETRSLLLGIRNILNSLNTIVFISYAIVLILTEVKEKERVLRLNEKLNTANQELRTANEKLEEYARESEKAAETRERNRLAREIHDTLGHSLTGIITGIDACVMLVDVAPEATKEQLKAIAGVARQGIKDVRRSVKALRPDALESLNLKSALVQMMEETKRSTGVEITWQIEPALKGFNKDEEDIIYRIVQESITNAIRHGRADKVEVGIHRDFNMLKIHIEDNGVGCSKVQKGFGLHHMEERLDMLKGSLSYHGDHGFVIDASIPIRWGRRKKMIKILIADDQELIRQSLMIILNSESNFQVTDAVANGVEVIRSVRKEKPDVILMDIRMPEMDGVICTQIIKENYPDIKIIILTTFDDDEYVFNALKYGASGYLLKGISMKELTEAIHKVFHGTAMINEDIASKVVRLFSRMAQSNIAIQVDERQSADLKDSEWQVIVQVGSGLSNKEIAAKLNLSDGTVRNCISTVLSKLNLRDRTQLAIWAVQTGAIHKVFGEEN